VRFKEVLRERLDRQIVSIETPLGPVRFKIARRQDRVVNASPEYEDCAALAASHRIAIKEVQAVAVKAYMEQR
jgi:pyridinium-3,5-bisthiocarboxylic acid mononucleotide nickel chelatase